MDEKFRNNFLHSIMNKEDVVRIISAAGLPECEYRIRDDAALVLKGKIKACSEIHAQCTKELFDFLKRDNSSSPVFGMLNDKIVYKGIQLRYGGWLGSTTSLYRYEYGYIPIADTWKSEWGPEDDYYLARYQFIRNKLVAEDLINVVEGEDRNEVDYLPDEIGDPKVYY